MSAQASRGPIVIDTDVFGADLVRRSVLAERYEPIIVGRPAFISFQTAGELRYGALHALAQRDHDANRWVASTTLRLG